MGVDGSVNPLQLLGVGQQKVLLKGNNFGPVGTVVGATYVEESLIGCLELLNRLL